MSGFNVEGVDIPSEFIGPNGQIDYNNFFKSNNVQVNVADLLKAQQGDNGQGANTDQGQQGNNTQQTQGQQEQGQQNQQQTTGDNWKAALGEEHWINKYEPPAELADMFDGGFNDDPAAQAILQSLSKHELEGDKMATVLNEVFGSLNKLAEENFTTAGGDQAIQHAKGYAKSQGLSDEDANILAAGLAFNPQLLKVFGKLTKQNIPSGNTSSNSGGKTKEQILDEIASLDRHSQGHREKRAELMRQLDIVNPEGTESAY